MFIFTFKEKTPHVLDIKEEDIELCKSWFKEGEVLDVIDPKNLTRYVGRDRNGKSRWIKMAKGCGIESRMTKP